MRQGQGKIPSIWLMTDPRVAEADLLRAVRRLPMGSAVVVRHYGLPEAERRVFFTRIARIARHRHARVLLAGDADTALRWGADGHHGPTPRPRGAPRWLHSVPVHNVPERRAAERAGADAILLSPLFATRSHPDARPLGPARFAALAQLAGVPVIALGGVHPRHAPLLRRLGAIGYAAIGGLVPRARSSPNGRSHG